MECIVCDREQAKEALKAHLNGNNPLSLTYETYKCDENGDYYWRFTACYKRSVLFYRVYRDGSVILEK